MSNDKFQFPKLSKIYNESLKRKEPTLCFQIRNGKCCFLFMMFFDQEHLESRDLLYIFMHNIKEMIQLKLYGSHRNGVFTFYLSNRQKDLFKKELQIENYSNSYTFDFNRFFNDLNNSIPQELPLIEKIKKLRENWEHVNEYLPNKIIDDHDKTILLGPKRLPKNHSPREQTLRKLYLYGQLRPSQVSDLIGYLKKNNMTVAWTNDVSKIKNASSVLDDVYSI